MDDDDKKINDFVERYNQILEEVNRSDFVLFKDKPSEKRDLCAFLVLDRLSPSQINVISAAEHDEIFMSADVGDVAEFASDDDIRLLASCGVLYSEEFNCFSMFK